MGKFNENLKQNYILHQVKLLYILEKIQQNQHNFRRINIKQNYQKLNLTVFDSPEFASKRLLKNRMFLLQNNENIQWWDKT